jgi:hypothetical protein
MSKAVKAALRRADAGCQEMQMLDALLLAAGLAFFALAIAYVTACDHL